jgi:hypothetical protein
MDPMKPSSWRRISAVLAASGLAAGLVGFLLLVRPPGRDTALVTLTGEESLLPQLKGLTDLASGLTRARLDLAPEAPVRHTDISPFGINVFLNEEVDPAKREETVRLASEAGFHFLRQEFPWQDIEIHGKGDYEDRRNEPARSSWDKYDQIVELAEKYGMELIVRVSTPPSWSRARGDEVGTFAPPDHYADFGDFVYALVKRYQGRIRYYQLWNEPNIYPEWGSYSISPEDYTQLLKEGATRAREADPDVIVIAGALASTIAMLPDAPAPGNALNDALFLQRMYDAGAAPYFDIMAVQGYGLWSGPTDRRMHPRVMNFGRPQYIRDLMVRNGDSAKPIWISEMGWNVVPDEIADKRFGQVTPEQQARWTALAYERVLTEWPWVGVVNTWYMKRATDEWAVQGRPEAYFRLADPDFTLQPVYHALRSLTGATPPGLFSGTHEPAGWGIASQGFLEGPAGELPFGKVWTPSEATARMSFSFEGKDLSLVLACPPGEDCAGAYRVAVDGGAPVIAAGSGPVTVASELGPGLHSATIEADRSAPGLAAISIGRAPQLGSVVLPGALVLAAVLLITSAAFLWPSRAGASGLDGAAG